ncbi:MAG: hypothetical protein KAJ52_04650 [Sedimentisphaerales bacterium]|nr:hypothetical protein [Sedimentisphaerales bacterium]
MNTTNRVFVRLTLVFGLVLIVGMGCSTATPVVKSTCTSGTLVSPGNHTTDACSPIDRSAPVKRGYTLPACSLAAGDSLGMRLIANHPVLVAQRTEAFNMAHNKTVTSY